GRGDMANNELIRGDVSRRFKPHGPASGDNILPVHTVIADDEARNRLAVLVHRHGARKKHNPTLVGTRRLEALATRIGDIALVEIEEWPGRAAIDAGRVERLRAKADRAVGHRGAHRYFVQVSERA